MLTVRASYVDAIEAVSARDETDVHAIGRPSVHASWESLFREVAPEGDWALATSQTPLRQTAPKVMSRAKTMFLPPPERGGWRCCASFDEFAALKCFAGGGGGIVKVELVESVREPGRWFVGERDNRY